MSDKIVHYYHRYMVVMGVLGQSIYFFQAYNIYSTQTSACISFWGFFISFMATTSWAIYGLLINNKVLAFANGIGFFGALWCLIMIAKYA